ncbi:MAG: DUF547 domain-containing protein [Myxococcota bacterium]
MMSSRRFLLSLGLLAVLAPHLRAAPSAFDHQHNAWTETLRGVVYDGMVSYNTLREDHAGLDRYLATLQSVTAAQYAGWSEAQQLAFWINAYNAYAVKLIVENHPVEGIRAIGLLPGSALDREFIPLQVLGGSALSLEDIQHRILRERFHDPRVHFALVTAARGSPKLRHTAYSADALHSQLEDAADRFINDPEHNVVDLAAGRMKLSPVFKWFRADFEKQARSLGGYLAQYLRHDDYEKLRTLAPTLKVEFLEFDWSLNGR